MSLLICQFVSNLHPASQKFVPLPIRANLLGKSIAPTHTNQLYRAHQNLSSLLIQGCRSTDIGMLLTHQLDQIVYGAYKKSMLMW